MGVDRITKVRVRGLRTLRDVTLDLRGFMVLIGENGSGKSSIIEVFELLRRAGERGDFLAAVNRIHGGAFSLARDFASEVSFDLEVSDGITAIQYGLSFVGLQDITRETLSDSEGVVFNRVKTGLGVASVDLRSGQKFTMGDQLAISSFGLASPDPGISRVAAALSGIEVHLPFEVRAAWGRREAHQPSPLRDGVTLQRAERLIRTGENLANCFFTLKNQMPAGHWDETMEIVRLGLGEEVLDLRIESGLGGPNISLSMEMRGRREPVPAHAISDGMLSYLAFVAPLRMPAPNRTVLAFDEPELHLHPALLVRVLGFFEEIADSCPVILATHSDRLLDALAEPAESALLCARVPAVDGMETELRRADPSALSEWLLNYRGLGELRANGLESLVMNGKAEA
jgi:predicted ATPase